ncbi:MAG: lactoylglutathione lyase-like lyase [Bacteroidetes bacterium]|jgi:catechol 2,3-dioxygenase-like lactoylglutathione lyase family enzyme|nr:lactoylglutathione lyase-like lyase [Bacteroidota bacterium]
MEARLNIITLGVKDLSRALSFYEKGLGWKRSEASQDNIIFFPLNGVVLALYPRDLLAEDATVSQEGKGFSGISLAYNTKSEKEVDEIIENVKALGAEIVKTPQKVFWGGYSAYFEDPEGHLFEVAYNPFFKMDGKGNLLI